MIFKTKSGETIEIDEETKRARLLAGYAGKRLTAEWREYQRVEKISEFGGAYSYLIVWGTGRDEVSATCRQIGEGEDDNRLRTTWTSRVIEEGYSRHSAGHQLILVDDEAVDVSRVTGIPWCWRRVETRGPYRPVLDLTELSWWERFRVAWTHIGITYYVGGL